MRSVSSICKTSRRAGWKGLAGRFWPAGRSLETPVLLHGIEEDGDSVWETRDVTLQKIHDFMKEGLQIVDLTFITLTDYHRIPQQPVYRNNCKVNRPIIVKLCNSNDKRLFFSKLKNLKQYNDTRKTRDLKPHYITDHLPKLFQQERKSLLPYFKQARRMQQKLFGELVMVITICLLMVLKLY